MRFTSMLAILCALTALGCFNQSFEDALNETPTSFKCDADKPCSFGYQCVDFVCRPPCATDLDCGNGGSCNGYFCAQTCQSEGECQEGSCIEGICTPVPGPNPTDGNCSEEFLNDDPDCCELHCEIVTEMLQNCGNDSCALDCSEICDAQSESFVPLSIEDFLDDDFSSCQPDFLFQFGSTLYQGNDICEEFTPCQVATYPSTQNPGPILAEIDLAIAQKSANDNSFSSLEATELFTEHTLSIGGQLRFIWTISPLLAQDALEGVIELNLAPDEGAIRSSYRYTIEGTEAVDGFSSEPNSALAPIEGEGAIVSDSSHTLWFSLSNLFGGQTPRGSLRIELTIELLDEGTYAPLKVQPTHLALVPTRYFDEPYPPVSSSCFSPTFLSSICHLVYSSDPSSCSCTPTSLQLCDAYETTDFQQPQLLADVFDTIDAYLFGRGSFSTNHNLIATPPPTCLSYEDTACQN